MYQRTWLRSVAAGIFLAFWAVLPASAQTGGQFCIRAFEDRDGDGVWAGAISEPLLTRDVAINLLNADGVVVDSGLLENSRTAAQGVFCFQFLPEGQYTALITSAELTATTPMSITALVNAQGEPVVVEYGAQRSAFEPVVSSTAAATDDNPLLRILLALGGAVGVMLGMAVLGALIYALALRRPVRASTVTPPSTQQVQAVTRQDSEQP
jgi:hypothetical protein